MAAIAAAESGANVIVVERSNDGGGSTRDSGGNIRTFEDVELAIEHYAHLSYGSTSVDVIRAMVETAVTLPDWFASHGGQQVFGNPRHYTGKEGYPDAICPIGYRGSAFESVPGAEGLGPRFQAAPTSWKLDESLKGGTAGGTASGTTLWQVLYANLNRLGASIHYDTRTEQLIVDADGAVIGVRCVTPTGDLEILADRGVILSCGGFADDPKLKIDCFGADLPTLCGPGKKTGEGIRMAQSVGADLFHMKDLAASLGYKFPEEPAAFFATMRGPGFILVDQEGLRYANETELESHAAGLSMLTPDQAKGSYRRLPSYFIFDEETRYDGPIVRTPSGYNAGFDWSRDNSREIERGWIKTATSIADLAEQIGLPKDALVSTVDAFNEASSSGSADPHGRPLDLTRPIASEPFYAVQVWPVLFNTQGGPRRDPQCRVLNTFGKPIQGLYSAGELGSMFGAYYPGGGNVTEALSTGIIAGRAAASA